MDLGDVGGLIPITPLKIRPRMNKREKLHWDESQQCTKIKLQI